MPKSQNNSGTIDAEDINIWFLKTNTGGDKKTSISGYCLGQNNPESRESTGFMAIGWSLLPRDLEETGININRDTITNLNDYVNKMKRLSGSNRPYKKDAWRTIVKFAGANLTTDVTSEKESEGITKIKENDLVWLRHSGVYYLAKIDEKSTWNFNSSEEATSLDACNQRGPVTWYRVGEEDLIPGAITVYRKGTIPRIVKGKAAAKEFSIAVYNFIVENSDNTIPLYRTVQNGNQVEEFYRYLGPDDVEDLLAMWLWHDSKRELICIPSTSKHSTQTYEHILINPTTGQRHFTQVKNSSEIGKAEDKKRILSDLFKLGNNNPNDIICLFVTGMKEETLKSEYKDINNIDKIQNNVLLFGENKANELFRFAQNPNLHMPRNIDFWINWLKGNNERDKLLSKLLK